jgi:hypothetical protein
MIYIDNTKDNTIYATLSCDVTESISSGSKYTLTIESPQQNNPFIASVTDISISPERYNQFLIPSGSLASGSVIYLQASYYDYTFTLSGSINVLETGKCIVTTTTGSKYVDVQTDKTIKYVDNQ